MSKKIANDNTFDENWNSEAEQNWVGFCNLLLKEDLKQNPNLYKKNKNASSNCKFDPESKNEQAEEAKNK